jgi:hypothetical protein
MSKFLNPVALRLLLAGAVIAIFTAEAMPTWAVLSTLTIILIAGGALAARIIKEASTMCGSANDIRQVAGKAGRIKFLVDTTDETDHGPVRTQTAFYTTESEGAPIYVAWQGGEWLKVKSPKQYGPRLNEEWVRRYIASEYEDDNV